MARNAKFLALFLLLPFVLLDVSFGLDEVSFSRDVRPILSDKCFHCHGPDEHSRATELRLDQQQSIFADLGGYTAVASGKPKESELVRRILSTDPDEVMPPPHINKPLSPDQIQVLRRWIEQGAKWAEHWAYETPRKTSIPTTESSWPRNWIDHFVLAQQQTKSLEPSKPADRVTLIRRLYFDLHGLPPTPSAVSAFLADRDSNAYEKIVDQLLASPHFGERLAVYWLDLVRYADTVGYHGDQDHNISPYRDWIINAFNSNMPFDQFTREQLAGDLLSDATLNQQIASGYNRLLQTSHEGGLQPAEYRAIYAADRVRNVSAVWMGATVGCAQCHDHKYDPYTAKDFYSLAAFFADIDDEQHFRNGTNALPTRRAPEIFVASKEVTAEKKRLDKTISDAKKRLGQLNKKIKQLSSKRTTKKRDSDDTNPQTDDQDALDLNEEKLKLEKELRQFEKQLKQILRQGAWTMVTKSLNTPRTTRVLPRGNWLDDSGPIVQPAIPEFMGRLNLERRGNRLDLANWLIDAESGSGKLTARVMANRIWYLLLGTGISKSLDDFGGQGQPPSSPQLLDNLALAFIDSDWNIKELIKLIVTSQTYRQSSHASPEQIAADPYNEYFARQSNYRLPAEFIRDNALWISGLLNTEQVGGVSVKPYQPAGYYRHLNFPPRKYRAHADDRQWRRGLYVHWQRQFLHPALKAMDAPTREECTAIRPKSNTPLAALVLLNDPTYVEAARAFAERILQTHPDDFQEQLNFAFQLAVSRSPDSYESAVFEKLLVGATEEFQANPKQMNQLLSIGTAKKDMSLDPLKVASWTTLTRAILNMDECITRN